MTFTLPIAPITITGAAPTIGIGTLSSPTPPGFQTDFSVRSVDMDGVVHAVFPTATVISYQETINSPEVATFTVPIDAPGLAQLPLAKAGITPVREVQIWRNGHLLFWGPPTTRRADSVSRLYTYTCKGPLWYLLARNVGQANRLNFLTNGSFQSGLGSWSAFGPVTASIDTSNFAIGTQSAQLDSGTPGGVAGIRQTFTFHADALLGDAMFITAWIYVDDFVAGALYNAGMIVELVGATGQHEQAFVAVDKTVPRHTWTRMSAIINIPPGVAGTIEVLLFAPFGTVHWDGVTVTLMESLAFQGLPGQPSNDETSIAAELVKYAQGRGSFAVFHGRPNGKSDLRIGVNAVPSGIKKSRVYQDADHQPIYQGGTGTGLLDSFAQSVDGFDFRVDLTPTTRTFKTYFPRIGVTHDDFVLSWSAHGKFGIVGWASGETIEQPCANDIVELSGWGTGPDREEGGFHDPASLGGLTLERLESVATNTPIDALSSIAAQRGALLKHAISVPTFTVAEPRDPVTDDVIKAFIGVIRAGDKVQFVVDDGDVQIDALLKIVQVTYDAVQETLALVPNTPT